jgi:predicted ATPase
MTQYAIGSQNMLLREIRASNLLSFGPKGERLELRQLNVLIGPNGSGKSNLLDAIGLLRAAPTHLAAPVRDGGGIRDWIWKGTPSATAVLEAVIENPESRRPLRHTIEFRESSQKFELVDERIENATAYPGHDGVYFYYRFQGGRPILNVRDQGERSLQRADVSLDESILSQRKDPDQYPEVTYLGQVYARIRRYREWSFGRYTTPRQPQKADQPNDFLESDCGNIGLVLNRLRRDPAVKRSILENLKQLYGGIEDYDVSIEGGTVQVFFHESGFPIPATRLSDGTLRYLCLLAILCHPTPPPLICIEEPELGLHPDLLPKIADLLVEASKRTQLVVTTHSDILVDAMTEHPEDVVVFEKHDGCTEAKRLDADRLSAWLDKYRLGDLWLRGEIGGTRW